MYDLLVGSVILWALGRVVKKKADAPAPGTIALPPQQRTSQRSQQMPSPGSVNYPSTSGGSQGPAYNPNDVTGGGPGGGRPGQL